MVNKTVNTSTILNAFWQRRKFIIRICILSFLLGLVIAMLTPKEYSSSTIILPQVSTAQGLGKKFGGFAKLVGINLGESGKNEIFPTLYPVVVNSAPFQKEILNTLIKSPKRESSFTLSEYLENQNTRGPLDYVKEYTIGLPGKLVKLIKGSKQENQLSLSDTTIFNLSASEKKHINYLEEHVSVRFNDVEGYIEVITTLPEPIASAQLTKRIQTLLQEYIIEYNIEKAKEELDYIENRLEEARENYYEKRKALGTFKDQNKNYIFSVIENQYEQLKADYDLAFDMYSQLSSQLESAKLQVKRDTPIFTILKPVTVPTEPSAPNKPLVVLVFIFLGFLYCSLRILFKLYWPVIKGQFALEQTKI